MSRELLPRPAEEAVRRLALGLLDRAHEASARLAEPDDAEALHDFRVAIRRLRSTLRAYRPFLAGSLPKKQLRRLRNLSEATNAGRDAEVQLAWLGEARPALRRHERRGHDWLAVRLAARREAAYRKLERELARDFTRCEEKLRARPARYRIQLQLDEGWHPEPFARVLGAALAEHAAALAAALAEVRSLGDERPAHAARIAAKRLRYVLDPFAAEAPESQALAKRLRALQDLLGDLNDAHLLAGEIGAAFAVAASERASRLHELTLAGGDAAPRLRRELRSNERPGLLALTRSLAGRREELFARLEREWLGERSRDFFRAAEHLAHDFATGEQPT